MAYIYKHTRLDTNEVFYIGVSTQKHKYRKNSKERNPFWKNITSKTNYISEIIEDNLEDYEAKLREIYYIKLYGRRDLGLGTLVNLTDGGDGVTKLSTEAIKRGSEIRKSKNRKVSEELKEKLRSLALGNQNMKGKKHSEETLEKCRENSKKWIINLETGIYYKGVIEAGNSINKNENYLGKRLTGLLKNNTPFIYI